MRKKLRSMLITGLFVSSASVTVCFAANGTNETIEKTESTQENTIQVTSENLTEMIMKDEMLVPGNGLEWEMSCEDFLKSEYGSEELDSESDKFEEYRVGEMPNGMLSYSPKVTVIMEKYDASMDMTCIFNQDKELIKVCYRQIMPASQSEEYLKRMQEIMEEAEDIKELEAAEPTVEELTEEKILGEPVSMKWISADTQNCLQMNSVKFDDSLIMDLVLSVEDEKS